MAIKYLKHAEIDKGKWDDCILKATNSLIYVHSFYLDNCTDHGWDALVLGDYDIMMPLPYRKKYGIEYIYTPVFTPQLGLFSSYEITESIIIDFFNAIPRRFKYIDLMLNETNHIKYIKNGKIRNRVNFVLPLKNTYTQLEKEYSKDAKKNLKKSKEYNLKIIENIELEKVFSLYKCIYGNLNEATSTKDYQMFLNVSKKIIEKKLGFTIAVENISSDMLACAFFTVDAHRISYLLGAPTQEGRKYSATHLIIDAVIKKYAETDFELDFEGSDIENVATFYKKFSPQKRIYHHVIINRLPFFIKWLKR